MDLINSICYFLQPVAQRALALLNRFYDINRQQINILIPINFTLYRCNIAINISFVYQIQNGYYTVDIQTSITTQGFMINFNNSIRYFLQSVAHIALALLNRFYEINRQQINILIPINFTLYRHNIAINISFVYQIQSGDYTVDIHIRVTNVLNHGAILPI
jgi:hypothetical protein